MNMRLLGARHIGEVVPDMLDASSLSNHIVAVPGDNLSNANCEPRPPPAFPSRARPRRAGCADPVRLRPADEMMQSAGLRTAKPKM